MKAFLLAAGKGTRLRPLTDRVPKCLVPIGTKPLLQIWLDILEQAGVTDILINTHHLADQVRQYINQIQSDSIKITLFHEETLLGSAGTVAANRSFIDSEEPFYIIYADNLTRFPLHSFWDFHRQKQSIFSIGLFKSPEPSSCGIAILDEDDRIIEFQEKPPQPLSSWANAGIYLADHRLFQLLPCNTFSDFGYDILPQFVGKAYGFKYDGLFHDTGTPKRLDNARKDWLAHNTI